MKAVYAEKSKSLAYDPTEKFDAQEAPPAPKPTPVLEEAHTTIYGNREKTHGDPGKNLRIIADYWNTYLTSKGVDLLDGLDYADVCNMMVLMKVARLANTPFHHDSMVDICGYTALADRIKEKRNA